MKRNHREYKVRKCGKCNLWGGWRKTTAGLGNVTPKVFIVGESPGVTELGESELQEGFTGFAGGVLDWALIKSGFIKDHDDRKRKCYVTNCIKCYPSRGFWNGNDLADLYRNKTEVDGYHVKRCARKHLWNELRKGKPKYVLLLGKHAYAAFTDTANKSIEKERGFWNWSDRFNCWYFATLHPAYVLRNGDKTSTFYRDIEHFVQTVQSGKPPKIALGKSYKTITNISQAKVLFNKLSKKKRVAWDTETRNARLFDPEWFELGMAFCWSTGQAAYIPLKKENGKPYWGSKQKWIHGKLKRILEDETIKKDGQNIKFDVNVARKIGITVRGVDWDTMQGHHLFDETTFSNLTFLTSWYRLGFPKYEDDIKPHIGKYTSSRKTKEVDYSTIPLPILGKYGCADVDAVWRIRRIQKKAASKRIKRIYYTISTEMSKSAAEMEWNGALIDVERISKMEAEYDKEIGKVNARLSKLVKKDHFNVASNPQMQQVLYGDKPGNLNLLKNKFLKSKIKKTKAGNPSTDKDTFELIRRTSKSKRVLKVLDLIQEVRKMRKMRSTYLTGFRVILDPNNRVHTSYLTTGTVTGRYASEGPNLQNIPRDPIFRSLFIAGKNRRMIPADYSQIEARLIAWLANEIDYILQFADPDFDPHTYNSATVREKPMSEVTKEERSYDKAVTFGMNYGRSNKSIAETYDLELEFVDNFVTQYFRKFKHIRRWRNRQIRISSTVRENGTYYLQSKTGRRRHFHAYEWIFSDAMKEVYQRKRDMGDRSTFAISSLRGTMERQSINFPIQSYASDLLSLATARVRKRLNSEGLDAFLVLTVHDMIAIDTGKKHAKQAAAILEDEMPFTKKRTNKKTGKQISLAFPVDYEITSHWKQ